MVILNLISLALSLRQLPPSGILDICILSASLPSHSIRSIGHRLFVVFIAVTIDTRTVPEFTRYSKCIWIMNEYY